MKIASLEFALAFCLALIGPAFADQVKSNGKNSMSEVNFRYFESLRGDKRTDTANSIVNNLFPDGTSADEFESKLTASGAKCARGSIPKGSFVSCIYTVPDISLISTDWVVSADLDMKNNTIKNVSARRHLTGL